MYQNSKERRHELLVQSCSRTGIPVNRKYCLRSDDPALKKLEGKALIEFKRLPASGTHRTTYAIATPKGRKEAFKDD